MDQPESVEELAQTIRRAALLARTICLEGNGSKCLMAGPVEPADEYVSVARA